MLNKIVEIIDDNSSSIKIEDGVLFCEYLIDDISFLKNLYSSNIIENSIIDDYHENEKISLEFSIPRLLSIGFYLSKHSFLQQNYYNFPQKDVYLYYNIPQN